MKITPLAFDSMGTRSMATLVETHDTKILIDPGVALSPSRFNLPPHPREIKRRNSHWNSIIKNAKKSDILIVTHYHYDHHNPDEVDIWRDKIAILKNPTHHINKSQTTRSAYFLKSLEGIPKEIQFSDGGEFNFSETRIRFSDPMPHGLHDRLGYVTEVMVEDKTRDMKFIHTSDVLGPCSKRQADFIIRENPDVIFADGPLNFTLRPAVENLIKIVQKTDVKKLVVDHHLLRDINWEKKIRDVFSAAGEMGGKTRIMTAAEFAGKRNDLLEARRRELWSL